MFVLLTATSIACTALLGLDDVTYLPGGGGVADVAPTSDAGADPDASRDGDADACEPRTQCGECGRTCRGAESCSDAGRCPVGFVGSTSGTVNGIATLGQRVYWTVAAERVSGYLGRVESCDGARCNGGPTPFFQLDPGLDGGFHDPKRIVAHAGELLWTADTSSAATGGGNRNGSVFACAAGNTCSSPVELLGGDGPAGLAVSDAWIAMGAVKSMGPSVMGLVFACPRDGGSRIEVLGDASSTSPPTAVALVDDTVLWSSRASGGIISRARLPDGGTASTFEAAANPVGLAWSAGSQRLAWADSDPSKGEYVVKTCVPRSDRTACVDGSGVELARSAGSVRDLAVDERYAYWAVVDLDGDGGALGTVLRAPLAGGPVVTLAGDRGDLRAIAVEADMGGSVYFAEVSGTGSTISRTRK
jgi:hypothetical protein